MTPRALDRRGSAAIELALIAPVLALLFIGLADFGVMILKRMQLNDTLAGAANYALLNQAAVTSGGGGALATTIVTLIGGGTGTSAFADAKVVVNNGPVRLLTGGVVSAPTSTDANADLCYCPTLAPSLTWGASVTCGNACASGLRAGKFVQITASRAHSPIFASYGLVKAGTVSVTTLVQTG